MSPEEFNARYPVGTPVVAYPGARPGDQSGWGYRRLETRTTTGAWLLGGHTPVVMVEGHAACIALTHIDPTAAYAATRGEPGDGA